jgi:alpha-L-arabinofuranosidase
VTDLDLVNPILKVADAMTTAPRTCSPASTVLEAVMIFRDADCGAIPITDAGKPIGILTDRDVALALAGHEADLARTPVGELMTRDVVTIDLDETLDAAMDKLGDHRVRRQSLFATITLKGASIGSRAQVETIQSENPGAFNHFATPEAVSTRSWLIQAGERFTLELPRGSVSVVTLEVLH